MTNLPVENIQVTDMPDIFTCYQESKYLSVKHSSYFQVYDDLLSKYRNRPIVFVEVGVLNGGSLFMWRKYFGAEARIIGIDLNPIAKKWEAEGFEIYIGSQSDDDFWTSFFSLVGNVDIILDDGGHTNEQQIITTYRCLPHINNGGMLIVEDVHASYMSNFGNPSKFSFVNYSKHLIDAVNSRSFLVEASGNPLNKLIYSIGIYESIVCFKIDRQKCFVSSLTSNNGISMAADDFRHKNSYLDRVEKFKKTLATRFYYLKRIPLIKYGWDLFFSGFYALHARAKGYKLKKYFS